MGAKSGEDATLDKAGEPTGVACRATGEDDGASGARVLGISGTALTGAGGAAFGSHRPLDSQQHMESQQKSAGGECGCFPHAGVLPRGYRNQRAEDCGVLLSAGLSA